MLRIRGILLATTMSVASACDDGSRTGAAPAGGTVIIATTADADALFPPLVASMQGRQVTELVFDYLAAVGTGMNTLGDHEFVPQLARSWAWSADSLSIAFDIHPSAAWHDGRRVTADDVVATWRIYTDSTLGAPTAQMIADIDSVTARDSATAVFWFAERYPQQFFDAASQMLIMPRHVYGGMRGDSLKQVMGDMAPVGSGRYRFIARARGSSLELAADTANYRGRPGIQRVIWTMAPEFTAAVTKLFGGEADVFDALRADNVRELARHPHLKTVALPGMDYVFMHFNLRDPRRPSAQHPLFGDRELRRALTRALDRETLVRSVFDSLARVPVGPTVRAFASTDTTIRGLAHDSASAAHTLDSLGWKRDAKGMRSRDGKPLRFTLLVPASSANRVRMGVLIQENLRRAGVRVDLEQMDFPAFMSRQQARSFDATLAAFHLGASAGGVRQTWGSAASRDRTGTNYGSYESALFDAQVDSALADANAGRSKTHFSRAYQLIVDDAPAVWLYEPRTIIGMHRRIRPAPMRPDAWWLSIPDWSIPAAERIPRDAPPAR